jgi:hypothetical protein
MRALDSDPDYLAFKALATRQPEGTLDALQLWTTWRRDRVAPLLAPGAAKLSPITEALIDGLQRRTGRRLRAGEIRTFDLLMRRYKAAGGRLPLDAADEAGHLRVCERCAVVTRGDRKAGRCAGCGHRHSAALPEDVPRLSPCPECGVRPVTDWQARCEVCNAGRTSARKATQARRRRARQREESGSP